MIFSIMTKKLWGTGEVRNPKGELKNGVYQPPQEFLAKLTKEKVKLSNDARKVLGKRWSRKNDKGEPSETPEETFARVAWWVAQVDGVFGQDMKETTWDFYRLLAGLLHLPDSPVFTGSGTPLGQLAGCFVLPISDDMGRVEDGIFATLKAAALVQQTGGGNGFSFSRLREGGSVVVSSMGRASGPLGFLRVYDAAFGEIAQGGTRRGANMGVLRVDHPDIFEFVRSKSQEGKIANFNISVALTDKFMDAVEKDSDFDLISPRDGKVKKTIRAKELFDEIIKYAHHNGEPGALFIDAANRTNPVPHLYELGATNPCGEQWLGPYESCCLGAVNLAKNVKDGKIDWEMLAETVHTATHFHDNIVSINRYVPEVPQLKEAAYKCRRIGIGIMGLADMMYELGIRYGGRDGEELAGQIMEFVKFHTMVESIRLASDRGPFPGISGSIYDKKHFSWQPPEPLSVYRLDFGRPKLDWDEVVSGIKKHGIRNSAQQVIGPCGTKGTVAEVEGYGCEPVFALAYIRHVVQEGEDFTIHYRSPLFEKALIKNGVRSEAIDKIFEKIEEESKGGCQNISEIPEELKEVFVVSGEISADGHVRMQAALQPFVDNSISKTCNFPSDAIPEDVAKAYFQAWKLGCKGLTVYVTGSREKVILETKATAKSNGHVNGEAKPHVKIAWERPVRVSGATYKIKTPVGTAFITVNHDENGNPIEVFINIGKAGSDIGAMAEALGRIISKSLKFNGGLTQKEKAMVIVDQLGGIGGRTSVGFGMNKIRSLPDAIAIALSTHMGLRVNGDTQVGATSNAAGAVMAASSPAPLKDWSGQTPSGGLNDPTTASASFNGASANGAHLPEKTGDICPSCGSSTLVYEEGCVKCHACGHSEC